MVIIKFLFGFWVEVGLIGVINWVNWRRLLFFNFIKFKFCGFNFCNFWLVSSLIWFCWLIRSKFWGCFGGGKNFWKVMVVVFCWVDLGRICNRGMWVIVKGGILVMVMGKVLLWLLMIMRVFCFWMENCWFKGLKLLVEVSFFGC